MNIIERTICYIWEKRAIYVEDQESDKCCSSKVNNIQRSGGDSSRLSVCSRQLRKKKRRRRASYSYTHTGSITMNVNGSVLFFLLLVYTYTYIYIYIHMHMSMRWKERERCSVRKRPWFRRSLEVVTRLLIAQKEQPTCMCICDNDTVKINKTLYSR